MQDACFSVQDKKRETKRFHDEKLKYLFLAALREALSYVLFKAKQKNIKNDSCPKH